LAPTVTLHPTIELLLRDAGVIGNFLGDGGSRKQQPPNTLPCPYDGRHSLMVVFAASQEGQDEVSVWDDFPTSHSFENAILRVGVESQRTNPNVEDAQVT
jgi:hypothetical protein